jgi:hypothetical protein
VGKIFLGSDPDIHNLSIAAVNEEGELLGLWMIKEKNRYKGQKGRESTRIMASLGAKKLMETITDEYIGTVSGIAVEGQNVAYTVGTGAKPQDIVDLAGTAGAILCLLGILNPDAETYYPAPSDWKGTIKKSIHQNRTMKKMGWLYVIKGGKKPYPVPDRCQYEDKVIGPDKINDGDWADVADSVGLALWARDEYYKELRRGLKGVH